MIDLGDNPIGSPPTSGEKQQIRKILGFSEIFATDYEVVGDGVTDVTVKLQNAVNASRDFAISYGCRVDLILPSGILITSKTADIAVQEGKHSITLYSNINIRGQGMGSTIIKLADTCAADTPVFLSPDGESNIIISDITIDGNRVARGVGAGAEDEGINFKKGNHTYIHRVEIKNCGQDAVDLDDNTNIVITDCYFHDNGGAGVHFGGVDPAAYNLVMDSCIFERNGFTRAEAYPASLNGAFDCTNGFYAQVSNCRFTDNAREFASEGCYVTFSNCIFTHDRQEDSGSGNKSYDCIETKATYLSFDSCIFKWTYGDGIDCQAASAGNMLKVSNSWFVPASTARDCIKATDSGAIGIFNNVFAPAHYQVYLIKTRASVQIVGNTFLGTSSNGVRIQDSHDGLISGNLFGGSDAAILLESGGCAGWTISNNRMGSNLPIDIRASAGINNLIINNDCLAGTSLGGTGTIKLAQQEQKVIGNRCNTIQLTNGTHVIQNNYVVTSLTGTAAYWGSSSLSGNHGPGVSGVLKGTGTLVAGTLTISTIAAKSTKVIRLWRLGLNSSSALGYLTVGTITDGTSFVVNSLDAASGLETDDTSIFAWEILE